MNIYSGHLFVYLHMKFIFRGSGFALPSTVRTGSTAYSKPSFRDSFPSCVRRATAGPEALESTSFKTHYLMTFLHPETQVRP